MMRVLLVVLMLFPVVAFAETFRVNGYEVWATVAQRNDKLVCEGRITSRGAACKRHAIQIQTSNAEKWGVVFEISGVDSIDGPGESRLFKAAPWDVGMKRRVWRVDGVNIVCLDR